MNINKHVRNGGFRVHVSYMSPQQIWNPMDKNPWFCEQFVFEMIKKCCIKQKKQAVSEVLTSKTNTEQVIRLFQKYWRGTSRTEEHVTFHIKKETFSDKTRSNFCLGVNYNLSSAPSFGVGGIFTYAEHDWKPTHSHSQSILENKSPKSPNHRGARLVCSVLNLTC